MTSQLPPNLLRLFAPRPPLPYLPPVDPDPKNRKLPKYTGVAKYLEEHKTHDLDYIPTETMAQKQQKRMEEKKEAIAKKAVKMREMWDPLNDKNATSDPYKTLFISNLAYETTEAQLRKVMEAYGEVKHVFTVQDHNRERSKGYAFVEFEKESGMKVAYKEAEGVKLNGRRMLVDVERGRTVKGWLPKKLGGGLGKKRVGHPPRQFHNHTRATPKERPVESRSERKDSRSDRDRERPSDRDRDRNDRDRERYDRDKSYRGPRSDRDRYDHRSDRRTYHDRDSERRWDDRRMDDRRDDRGR
ncbi:hypothetical protein HK103_003033 [Boothiomyces macroporosus]|uniref:RRM domain-containing protein n=1 Tax=Boothiomyces macroporosus TaxID=261099 RepID=A0AAD5Y477_9FUNG|nr:hypothetical protein HK103_003033 [Boothiomyces macroporosus]